MGEPNGPRSPELERAEEVVGRAKKLLDRYNGPLYPKLVAMTMVSVELIADYPGYLRECENIVKICQQGQGKKSQ